MPGSFLDRLGELMRTPLRFPGLRAPQQSAPDAPPPGEPPVATVEPAPAAEVAAPATETAPTYGPPADAAPAEGAISAPMSDTAAPAPPSSPTTPESASGPAKSAEELEEERLWGEVHAAWARGDFEKVSETLIALRTLEPEDAAEIDEKLAAAQYNCAAQLEQQGEWVRALALYQEAQRRNPNLGEAGFAIERLQARLQPDPAAVPAEATSQPAEQSYTVQEGDTLSAIAERYYGSANEWPRIFEANRDQIENPDLIYAGQTLRIPG